MAKQAPKQDNSARWATAGKKAAKTWAKSRTAKAGGGFSNPEIEDGNYLARVIRAKADFTKGSKTSPSVPYMSLTLVIVEEGDYQGVKLNRMDRLDDADPDNAASAMERFAKTMDGIGFDVSELELSEVPALAEAINDAKPFTHITVKNSTSEKTGKEYLNVYCNKEATAEELADLGISDDAGEGEGDDDSQAQEAPKKTPPKGSGGKRTVGKSSRGNARK